eukprot:scaffold1992_cov187-Amphora_coffeaeformis.AAC.16
MDEVVIVRRVFSRLLLDSACEMNGSGFCETDTSGTIPSLWYGMVPYHTIVTFMRLLPDMDLGVFSSPKNMSFLVVPEKRRLRVGWL